ncbi:hypothetical protein [Helicobacter pylori]|uniref:hypothetical protein n=1 Tax=Helicobacter pylori TaxID=210 RepID=UPI0011CA4F5E|nr:hypothetical protein [Helicobacter pylori]QEE96772.1 hypothetical protein D2C89_02250 [Helicobacter pylori]QEE98449.1 hypothetical protein D2C88_03295 [Helicobacter pylori]
MYIYGAENGYKDIVIFNFHFDWKKETHAGYEIEFKDFSEILLTLESKLKEVRQKHEAKVKSEAKKKEGEEEMIKQEIKKVRDFISLEREKGTHEIIAFSSNIKSLIMGIAKREGVEISKIEHLVDYLSLCYYHGFKDISTSRITDRWIFLEAYNNIGKLKSVYMLFDFMRDLKGDLIDNCKLIIAKD